MVGARGGTGPALDEEGQLLDGVPCRRCGYDLRGRRLDDACPECGTRVGESARLDLLRSTDPAWRRRLVRGALGMAVTTWIDVGVAAAWTLLAPRLILVAGPGGARPVLWAWIVVTTVVNAAWLVYYWKLTGRDPAGPPPAAGAWGRALAVVSAAQPCSTMMALAGVPLTQSGPTLAAQHGPAAAGVAADLIMAAVTWRLAARVPDLQLRARIRAAGILIGAFGIAAIALATLWPLLVFSPLPRLPPAFWSGLGTARLGTFIVLMAARAWWAFLLLRLRREIAGPLGNL